MFGRLPARAAVAIAVLAAIFAAYQWWNSPERQIARILTAVDAALTHEEPGTGLDALTAVAELQQYLAPDVSIETGGPSGPITGRQDAVSVAARIRAGSPMMRIQWFDTEIAFEGETRAEVRSTAQVTMADASGQEVVDVHQVEARVEKQDGVWVVTAARRDPGQERAR